MRAHRRGTGLLAAGLALVLGACATMPPRATLASPHRQRAEALEREGALRRALDEYKIALTITPDDTAVRDAAKALEGRIERAAAEQIAEGRKALARGGVVAHAPSTSVRPAARTPGPRHRALT